MIGGEKVMQQIAASRTFITTVITEKSSVGSISVSMLLVVLAHGEMARSIEQFLVPHHLFHLHSITFTFSSINMIMQLSGLTCDKPR